MKLVIFTTNRYPKYDREELPFETLEAAERKMNELVREPRQAHL